TLTEAGRSFLAKDPDTPGSLGMAVSEAVEVAAADAGTRYSLGSVLNHVCLHQTIIGEETLKQLEMFGEEAPEFVFGCAGGAPTWPGSRSRSSDRTSPEPTPGSWPSNPPRARP